MTTVSFETILWTLHRIYVVTIYFQNVTITSLDTFAINKNAENLQNINRVIKHRININFKDVCHIQLYFYTGCINNSPP